MFNRVIQNNIEHSVMFFLNFGYYLFQVAEAKDAQLVNCLALYFVAGRLVYSFGYITGFLFENTGPRALGFGITTIVNMFIAGRNFGLI
mmetsp:Transcript_27134/g.24003  ORF Transcript_27134/g.24003 Transcript_27134/m.24003 type:complete len:89 (-) Transcript_27134:142-408(-)